MKRTIGWTAHALFLATVLLAIWSPVGAWWQWAATAFVLLLIGAVLLGQPTVPKTYAEGGEIPMSFSGPGAEEARHPRPKYGKRAE